MNSEDDDAEVLAEAVAREALVMAYEDYENGLLSPGEAAAALTAEAQDLGLYEEDWWPFGAATWLLREQRLSDPKVLWFNAECDEEALRRERGEPAKIVDFEPEKPKAKKRARAAAK